MQSRRKRGKVNPFSHKREKNYSKGSQMKLYGGSKDGLIRNNLNTKTFWALRARIRAPWPYFSIEPYFEHSCFTHNTIAMLRHFIDVYGLKILAELPHQVYCIALSFEVLTLVAQTSKVHQSL